MERNRDRQRSVPETRAPGQIRVDATQRRIQGIMQQITVEDPALRRASLRKELVALGKTIMSDRLPAFEAVIDDADSSAQTDEAAYLQDLAVRLTDFFNTNFNADDLERRRRDMVAADPKNVMLNEVLYYGTGENNIHIHVAPAETLSIGRKLVLLRQGLKDLAKRIVEDPALKNMEEITATSWIVAAHPNLLEGLGFTFDGPIDEETHRTHFADETRPVAKAHITREDFLKRYG